MKRLRQVVVLSLVLGTALAATAGASTSRSSQPPLCATSNLKVTQPNGGPAAGTTYLSIVYQNTGRTTCRINGYPGVTLYASGNRQLAIAKRGRGGGGFQSVALKPQGRAFSVVSYVDNQLSRSESCRVPTKMRIYPPNNRTPILISLKLQAAEQYCPHGALVYPVAATRAKASN